MEQPSAARPATPTRSTTTPAARAPAPPLPISASLAAARCRHRDRRQHPVPGSRAPASSASSRPWASSGRGPASSRSRSTQDTAGPMARTVTRCRRDLARRDASAATPSIRSPPTRPTPWITLRRWPAPRSPHVASASACSARDDGGARHFPRRRRHLRERAISTAARDRVAPYIVDPADRSPHAGAIGGRARARRCFMYEFKAGLECLPRPLNGAPAGRDTPRRASSPSIKPIATRGHAIVRPGAVHDGRGHGTADRRRLPSRAA